MANVTILSSCVQGLPYIGTGETVAVHSNPVTITQIGTGYFYRGTVVNSDLVSTDSAVIAALVAEGAII